LENLAGPEQPKLLLCRFRTAGASLRIYGVLAYSVARRRNEISIRMSLYAQRSQLLGLVIRQGAHTCHYSASIRVMDLTLVPTRALPKWLPKMTIF
jgi:hypothetical protein